MAKRPRSGKRVAPACRQVLEFGELEELTFVYAEPGVGDVVVLPLAVFLG
jgi:hypothetical protein